MIEMIFVIPIMIILIAFVVDLGLAIYTKNALADATQASVRVASQRGGAVMNGRRVAQEQFYTSINGAPGMESSSVTRYTIGPNLCTNASSTIEARSTYQYSFITPGLNAIFAMIGSDGVGGGMQINAASALRCEIVWR